MDTSFSLMDGIQFRILKEDAVLGSFYGTAETPVEVDDIRVFGSMTRYRLNHVHDRNGKCVKSKYGFCN